jgi:FAD/FMN-containing dehydrogenase/Fe-S oxidoreductase
MAIHNLPIINVPAQRITSSTMLSDARDLERELRQRVEGEVRFDDGTRAMYAVDASNYRQPPIGVVIPKSEEDVIATVAACREFGAPLLSRGGGTSLAGQCCNAAVVLDWSKYLNNIIEINAPKKYAWVQPGTICDDLKNATEPFDLVFGPDPATHNHCTFGGMIGNNSCGAHAQMSGKADNNVEALDILLYDGTRMTVGWMDDRELRRRIAAHSHGDSKRDGAAAGREAAIYADLLALRERYSEQIRTRYTPIPRRVSGYNLDQLLPGKDGRFNIARALVGSEGTLVTILRAKVRLMFSHPQRCLVVLGYPDAYEAADHVPEINEYAPIALEGMDHRLLHNVQKKGGPNRDYLKLLPEGHGFLIVEFGELTQAEAIQKAERLMARLKRERRPPVMKLVTDKSEQHHIWQVRESGLGATAFVPGEPDAWPGWEDSAVAPEKLGGYLRDLRKLYDKYGYNPALYGHFGQGCVHCRVDFDLRSAPGIEKWKRFLDEATSLVVGYGGSLSGEHGDGQARAPYLQKMFGSDLIEAFREYKSIWDPDWKMNPGKLVDSRQVDQNLRIPGYPHWEPKTHFQFPNDGGKFSHAVMRCVGIGKCRRLDGKGEQDTMCPSFMVTREELHATRGRAHQLWEMLQGEVIAGGWRDDNVKKALDLCLSCKGCKGDCPVNVDMATYKAEFLSHYWEGRLRPRSAYAFGYIDRWSRMAALAPGFVNLFTQLPLLRNAAKLAAGIPQKRSIPAFAPRTFTAWFREREKRLAATGGSPNLGGPKVMLFPDTFNNHFFPGTLRAALEVLEFGGYHVVVPDKPVCCGRPLYDYGFLDDAKRYLKRDMKILRDPIEWGTRMVVLEPSCCSVFRDELHELLPDDPEAIRLAQQTFTLSEFLERSVEPYSPPKIKRRGIVQGHCHHKAIMRMKHDESVMKKMGLDAELLNSGCCGMAGSFGYEKDGKYEVSVAAGERVLLPAVRKADARTIVMADGFSCREQIQQQTRRHALHLAEVMRLAIEHGEQGPPGKHPESEIVRRRNRARRTSMLKAAAVTLAIGAGAWAVARWWLSAGHRNGLAGRGDALPRRNTGLPGRRAD